jgi:hypothetical protein
MGTFFTKLRAFFPQILHYDTLFPPLHETLYAGRAKIFTEASQLFTQPVSQPVVHKTASSECILQATKKLEVGEC